MTETVVVTPIKTSSWNVFSDNKELAGNTSPFDVSYSTTVTIPNPAYVPPAPVDPDAPVPDVPIIPETPTFEQPETLSQEVSFDKGGTLTHGSENVFVKSNGVARFEDKVDYSNVKNITFSTPVDPEFVGPAPNGPDVPSTTYVAVTLTGKGKIIKSGQTVYANDILVSRVGDDVELTLSCSTTSSTEPPPDESSGGTGDNEGGSGGHELYIDFYGNPIYYF